MIAHHICLCWTIREIEDIALTLGENVYESVNIRYNNGIDTINQYISLVVNFKVFVARGKAHSFLSLAYTHWMIKDIPL